MFRSKFTKKVLVILIIVFLLSGCSSMRSAKPTREMQIAVALVAFEYLNNVIQTNIGYLQSAVVWDDYSKNIGVSKDQYRSQLALLRDTSTPTTHPLVDLDLVETKIHGDDAEVLVQKHKQPDAPIISIKLHWSGEAWLVVEDSIFGRNGLIATHAAKNKTVS